MITVRRKAVLLALERFFQAVAVISFVALLLWIEFGFDEWAFMHYVFGEDSSYAGPLVGAAVYGVCTFLAGKACSEEDAGFGEFFWACVTGVLTLVCFVMFLARVLRVLW